MKWDRNPIANFDLTTHADGLAHDESFGEQLRRCSGAALPEVYIF